MAASKTPKRKNSSPSKAGRRTGENNTRNDILTAAKNLFAEHGFEGTSMRSIATRASVDPALIRHFFGNKEALFTHIITEQFALANQMRDSFQSGDSNRGRAIVSAYLQMWNSEDINPLLLGLVRSAISSADTNSKMQDAAWELFSTGPFGPGTTNIDPIAFSLMSSQLLGLAVGRYLMELPHLTSLSDTRIINELSPVIQRYIDDTYTEMDDAVQGGGMPRFVAAPLPTQAMQSGELAQAEEPAAQEEPADANDAGSAEDLGEEATEAQETAVETEAPAVPTEDSTAETDPLSDDNQPADAAPSAQAHDREEPAEVEATEPAAPTETADESSSDTLKPALDEDVKTPTEAAKETSDSSASTWEPEEILIAEELPVGGPVEALPLNEAEDNSPVGEYQRPDALENAHEPTLFGGAEPVKPAPKKSKKKEPAENQLWLFDGLF